MEKLILYIDFLRKAYSIRQLKKTLYFIEEFILKKGAYNKNYPTEKFHHSFKGYTLEN